MRKITIEVTREDIAAGHRASAYHCPVAIAVRRTLRLPPFDYVRVHPHGGYAYTYVGLRRIRCSRAVSRFAKRFDAHGKCAVKPFRFVLTLPEGM